MEGNQHSNTTWSCLLIDREMRIYETKNFDKRLFFGKLPASGENICQAAGIQNQQQAAILEASILKSLEKKRNTTCVYVSVYDYPQSTHVCGHIEYREDTFICVYLTFLYEDDLLLVPKEETFAVPSIYDKLPVGIAIYSKDGVLRYVNEFVGHIFGCNPKEIMDMEINIHDNSVVPLEMKDAIHQGVPIDVCFPYILNKDLKTDCIRAEKSLVRELACKGEPTFNCKGDYSIYICIISDITEKLQNEDALRKNRYKTEIAMKASEIMFWEFDVRDRLFYSDNEPMNGYDQSKPLTIDQYIETVHPEDRQAAEQIMGRMIAGEKYSFEFDAKVLFSEINEWQYCTINGSPCEQAEDGRVLKYVGIRKNNTALHKRKLLQDKILNSIPLSIHIKDVAENYRYVFCNDESKKLFGTSEDNTTYDVMDTEEVERIRKTDLEVYTSGNPYLGLERVILKDGRNYDTIVRKSVIEDEGKRLLLSIRWDQGLQNDLKRRSKLFSLTLESMNAFTWFYEPDKQRVTFGDGFDRVERNVSEINTLEKFITCLHPDDVQKYVESLEEIVSKESAIWQTECRLDLDNEGVYTWWEAHGILETAMLNDVPYKYMFGMSICIDPHKQAELTLLRNKEDLDHLIRQNELILNNTNSGLAYITKDYVVQWENISLCSKSLSFEAYKKGEYCYKSAHNRTTPCDNCALQRTFTSHQTEVIQFKLENNHMVEIFATPVFRADDTVDGIVIRVDDITERQQMIEELKQAKTLAEQSDKLKSAFLANMSHEIRTPLNAIIGFSELLVGTTEEEERAAFVNIINTNNELLLKLINDILDLSKIEAGVVEFTYEEFDLADYFNTIIASMRQRITNPNVRLIALNPCEYCKVSLDKNRVAQLMTNYVTNAIKYTPKGFIEMGYEYTGQGIRFYVKDSGIGIPDEKKEHVFHRFAKLDEFAQGTGLGLSICKAIAESMGGSVGFESRHGEGSLFWAFLPCKPEVMALTECTAIPDFSQVRAASALNQIGPACGSEILTGRKTVLIAEDMQSNFLLLSAILKNQYNILHAKNGRQAVDLVKENQIDLLFMDMKMPLMNGYEAVKEIRKFNDRIPIVALTAHAFEADRTAALAAGCNDFLVKPIDRMLLMSVLDKYCPDTGNP